MQKLADHRRTKTEIFAALKCVGPGFDSGRRKFTKAIVAQDLCEVFRRG